ncbi:peptidoglycan editing factor PgeF [Georgenia halophila]|uniref:Peptidoglycan editing factor PgeF n=1 Tax=Georgenia halophila TaxID=620889 RepID=A0ABP8L6K8_9MICO
MIPGFLTADLGPGARGGFTARAGGVSTGPYGGPGGTGGLNLGPHVGDDDEAVRANRARLEQALGSPVAWMSQVHGAAVEVIDGPDGATRARECDALVAPAGSGVALGVLVADCVPVLIADPIGVVGVAHVGRSGLVAGVLESALAAMADLGAEPGRMRAVVGPSICGRCYEVPAEMQADVAARVPGTASATSWGTAALDLPAGVRARLVALGVDGVHDTGVCTLEDERYYSYRRSGRSGGGPVTGRFAGVVRPAGRHAD